MTGEEKAKTEPWVRKHGAEFPYAYDPKGKLQTKLGVNGIPQAFLIDPQGTIVWEGHPQSLREDLVARHASRALPIPGWEWPKSLSAVKKDVIKGKIGKAFLAAGKKAEQDQSLGRFRDAIRGMIDTSLATADALREEGDYLGAANLAEDLEKSLSGLPEKDKAAEIASAIRSDKQAKKIITAQKQLAKLREERLQSVKDAEEIVRRLDRLAEKHPGSFVAREALQWAAELRTAIARSKSR